jgi:hypothetical protein
VRGLDITCGCFGHASKNLSFDWHLTLDLALLVAAVFLWFSSHRESLLFRRPHRKGNQRSG